MKRDVRTLIPVLAILLATWVLTGSSMGCEDRYYSGVLLSKVYSNQTIPQWSPDGTKIIFAYPPYGVFGVEADGSRIWTIPPNAKIEVHGTPDAFSPAISPDGTRVAYAGVVKRDETSEIVSSNLDGTDRRRLTDNGAVDAYPAWSPDSKQIAFISNRDGDVWRPYLMNADGSKQRGLAPSVGVTEHAPVWSPNGSKIAFVGQGDDTPDTYAERPLGYLGLYTLHTVKSDGSDLRELGNTFSVAGWSPDGSRIAFIKRSENMGHLTTMDPGGNAPRLLSTIDELSTFYGNLSWSPDGAEFIYDLGNSSYGAASWSPDGSRKAFLVSQDGTNDAIVTVARDGSDLRVLVNKGPGILVAANSNWREVSNYDKACSDGRLVPDPKGNPDLVRDCETLLQIRNPLMGDAVLNWSAQVPMSEWVGVFIEGSPPRVVRLGIIHFEPVKLNGVLSPEIGSLTGLRQLWLSSNNINGHIPPELGNLTNLRELDLGANALTGSIPRELGNLKNLEELRLSNNHRLTGSIPPEIGNLTNLQELWLSRNSLTGSIPDELGELSNLRVSDITLTQLTGCVPTKLRMVLGPKGTAGTDELDWC